MRIDEKECRFTCYAVAVIFLIIVLIIFLSNDDFYKKVNDSSGIAAWFQGLGTLLAIWGVWWQTRRQIESVRDARAQEESQRRNETIVRSRFILNESKKTCERIFEFQKQHIEQQKMHIENQSIMRSLTIPTFGSSSDFPRPNYQQYKDVLSTTILHLLNIPYWDIVDANYANSLLAIQGQAKLCILSLDYEPYRFIDHLNELMNKIKSVEKQYHQKNY